ncbi:MAG: hypothetical protein HQL19_06475, partial [Candidatus Omnitrophica bacterium]|nr:hypothetical protein [Candidatus Omnitrophota bacterium]
MNKHARALIALSLTLLMGGCGALKDKPLSPTQAERKLQEFLLKEGGLDIKTRFAGRTLWIYLPLTDQLFDVKPSPGDKAQKKLT